MLTMRLCVVALTVAAIGCANRSSTPSTRQPSAATGNTDVITAQALADPSVASGDALEAVRRLRPRFLMARGAVSVRSTAAGTVHVSIDGGPLMNVDYLKRIRANEISEMRYLTAPVAAQRFGISAGSGGVILVKSKS